MSTDISGNSTEMLREHNVTEYIDFDDEGDMKVIHYCNIAGITFLSVVGTALNLWFLVAILRSEELRSWLRNKIICNIFLIHLANSVIIFPLAGIVVGLIVTDQYYSCHLDTSTTKLWIIQDFIANWLLVMLVATFIAQIVNFDPKTKLTPRVTRFCTWGLLVFPWILSFLIVPLTVHGYRRDLLQITSYCVNVELELLNIFRTVDTIVPMCLMVILLIIAAFLKYKVRGRSTSSSRAVLIRGSAMTDGLRVYVVAVAVAILCDLMLLIVQSFFYTLLKYSSYKTM